MRNLHEEWWGYGTFFLVAAVAQVVYVPLLLRWPNRTVLLLGIGGNSAIVLLYLLTRVVGIPLFGPEAGEVEGVGIIDLCTTMSEVAIVVALSVLMLMGLARERTTLIGLILSAILLLGAHLPHLLLLLVGLLVREISPQTQRLQPQRLLGHHRRRRRGH